MKIKVQPGSMNSNVINTVAGNVNIQKEERSPVFV